MNINYLIIAGVVFIIIILLVLFLRRNKKDEQELENEVIQEDLRAEIHKEDKL